MQEWLNNNDILMYSTHNERKLVFAERCIKTLKTKNYKKRELMIEHLILVIWINYNNYNNTYYNHYNNTCHHSINKTPINGDYSSLTEQIETYLKAPKFKANNRVKITKHKKVLSKGYTENWSREISIINLVLKANPWSDKLKV